MNGRLERARARPCDGEELSAAGSERYGTNGPGSCLGAPLDEGGSVNANDRWRSHPVLGATVSGAAMMAPFVVPVVTAGVAGRVLARGHGGGSTSFGGPPCWSLRRSPSWCRDACAGVSGPSPRWSR